MLSVLDSLLPATLSPSCLVVHFLSLGSALLFGGSILLAFLGITFNIRFMYLTLLLKVFEFGREKIQRHSTKRKPPEQDPSSQDSSPSDSSSSELRNGSGDLIVKDEKVVIRAPTSAAPSTNKRESSASRSEGSSDDNGGGPDTPAPEKDSKDPDPATDDFHYELDAHLGSIKSGVEAIIDDEVTKRFSAEELRSWNLLTRTNENYAFISVRLTCIWFVGFVFRYAILLPIRVLLTSWAVGQLHGGFLGVIQQALSRASPHIWFERSEVKDRDGHLKSRKPKAEWKAMQQEALTQQLKASSGGNGNAAANSSSDEGSRSDDVAVRDDTVSPKLRKNKDAEDKLWFLILFGGSLFLALFGITLKARHHYVDRLLRVFEFGREKIERHSTIRKLSLKHHRRRDRSASCSSSEELPRSNSGVILKDEDVVIRPPTTSSTAKADTSGSRSEQSSDENVESGDEQPSRKDSKNRQELEQKIADQLHYDLDAHLSFIKSGVEAIIDDEITKRFSAEELQAWNLLTRTNANYAFISMRLTCIWFVGFVFRYTVLMPIRVLLTSWAVGQLHGGFLGVIQWALSRASPHIWFERSEIKDRSAVARRLREHVEVENNPPILIFPEGTCINNTSVMQFKKGSFETGATVYPVAMKYDPRFADAFWNSSKHNYMQYLYSMFTSWAVVADVWYLPPMKAKNGQSAVDFANRVKGEIARQGGLVDLDWDGQLKRMKPKAEWKAMQQEAFTQQLKLQSSYNTNASENSSSEQCDEVAAVDSTAPKLRKNTDTEEKAVTLHTDLGDLKLELYCDRVPKACENFLALCASDYYNGCLFHRNIKGFMVQTGDPAGTGKGGNSIWGQKFVDEIRDDLKHDTRGVVSMANNGPNTNGSQFFITYSAQPHLDLKYTVFGR
ncbi:unnamed protein product [Cyprideis torosa]|uniref:Uncharacterized protein n=1 Tax=Cyprideis torosa TaxID=163714 RepID=A0A7R8WE47_9CRUS|nr:unnamed protein product [Cyprideis torosa]CAG0895340.1 unnamed protein product [Cyprideis torosa]